MYSNGATSSARSEAGDADREDLGREAEQSTRERVIQLVVEEGPISAAALGRRLDITAAAVRRHLDAMTQEGIVEVKQVSSRSRGAGRPSRRYVISQRGQDVLGDDYLTLARRALDLLGARDGDRGTSEDDGARSLAQVYFADFEETCGPQLRAVEDLDDRTDLLARLLADRGFAGFTRHVGRDAPQLAMRSTQLCQGHCPIREIAEAHPVFCEVETEMIGRLLDVDVRRLSTQAGGAHVCTTHVPVGRERLAAEEGRRRSGSAPDTEDRRAGPDSVPGVGRRRIIISPRQQERLS
ncbi:MAG: winged helix-turn-helix transcriptional regulator [Nesterenkonia sp.]|uniref:helix-turn-helix transcriptional regulator n=1 Tax=Nesterenkonia marinintestina TaxID=2979865 RepID=UPI0021BE77E4|nr:helix-turn-helix domain-containing protein [Nesterenkonia sp. GX14115]MDO5493377.1 winged helix-turn-helix transcriptional regulator [Nesterenkonia sp.]